MPNQPIPIKNAAYNLVFMIFDNDGDLVSGAAGLDSEISKDLGTFADATNEASEIATSSGMYSLALTATEMNADIVAVITKTTTTNAKTTPIVLYPYSTTAGTEVGDGGGLGLDLATLRRMLRIRLDDLTSAGAAGGNYITEALDMFINLAYRESVYRTKCHKATKSVALVNGTHTYDLDEMYEPVEIILGVEPLKHTSIKAEGVSLQYWNTSAAGVPTKWLQLTGPRVRVHPTPDATAAGVISVVSDAPVAGGTLYAINDILTLVESGASGGQVLVTAVASGVVTEVRLYAGGLSYTTGTKSTTGESGSNCTISVSTVGALTVNGYAHPTALTDDAHTVDALPDAYAVSAVLDRAECFARRARPRHEPNITLAERLEDNWEQVLAAIIASIRAEGN